MKKIGEMKSAAYDKELVRMMLIGVSKYFIYECIIPFYKRAIILIW